MTTDWDKAGRSWHEFLVEVEAARADLGCSLSNAWFRGHRESSWPLLPSLLRPIRAKYGTPSSDDLKKLNELENFVSEKKRRATSIKQEMKSLRAELRAALSASDRAFELQLSHRIQSLEIEGVNCSDEIKLSELSVANINAVEPGEYDAFVDFRFRSGEKDGSSWVTLAKMQHFGIPTRLLDWTETLIIAIYFSISSYIDELSLLWGKDEATLGRDAYPLKYHDITHLPHPAVWVLNPYKLARRATGKNVLWSPGNGSDTDYFSRFFGCRDWSFHRPVPMYSPWENPRIAAQQGIFTVHGLCREPLERFPIILVHSLPR